MASLKRYLGKMMLGEFARQGWIGAKMIRELTRTTGTWRKTTMLRDIREAIDIETFGKAVREIPINVRMPKSVMVETELTRPRRFRIFSRVRETNIYTGRITYTKVSIYDDSWRTPEQWSEELLRQKKKSDSDPTVTIDDIDLVLVEHNKGWRY